MTRAEAAAFLANGSDFLLLCHRNPDGDTTGCAAALCLGLRSLGKTAYLQPDPHCTDHRLTAYRAPLAPPDRYSPQTVVAVDTASAKLLPEGGPSAIDLVIDHHISHRPFGRFDYVEHAAACGEVIFLLLREMGVALDQSMAEALYLAIATDTGCFRYGNTTPQTHRIVSALMETGFDFFSVNERFFIIRSAARLKIEQSVLSNLELLSGGKVAILTLPLSLVQELGATAADTDELSSLPRQIAGVQVGITIQEKPDHCKLSVRTARNRSATEICAQLGGGGHRQAGGCTVAGDIETARAAVLNALAQVHPDAWTGDC